VLTVVFHRKTILSLLEWVSDIAQLVPSRVPTEFIEPVESIVHSPSTYQDGISPDSMPP